MMRRAGVYVSPDSRREGYSRCCCERHSTQANLQSSRPRPQHYSHTHLDTSTIKKPQLDPHSDASVLEGNQAGCGGVVGFGILKCAWFGCARGGMLGGGEG